MGNQQQSQQQIEFLEKRLDANYGEVVIYLNKDTNEQFTFIKQVLSADVDTISLAKSISKRQQLLHQALIKIIKFENGEMADLCSSFNVLSIQVEYFSETLQKDIRHRREHKTTYDEMELLYLIYEIVHLCEFMRLNNNEIIDIHPQKILLDDLRQIKVFDQFLDNQRVSNYFKVLFGMRDLEYLSPEQLNQLKEEIRTDKTNQEKSNIFCVGVMVVSLMSHIKCVEFYNQETLEYKGDYVNQLLEKYCLKYTFSAYFKSIVQQLLRFHHEDRPDYKELLEQLEPYKHNFARQLSEPGKQQMHLGSSITTQSSRPASISQPQFTDFSEIDRLIKQARQRAQRTIDDSGLDLKLQNYKGAQFNIVEV